MSFTYEATSAGSPNTTGRLTSVKLRTGGTITYSYSGGTNGINCDGTSATMTRTTAEGTWTYVHTPPSGSGFVSSTKVTDPAGNDTVYTFASGFEIYRQAYQGSSSTGTLLLTTGTCYNLAAPNCSGQTSVKPPITEKDVYTYIPGVTNPSISKVTYDSSTGRVTESKVYDSRTGALLSDTTISYGTYSSGNCSAIGNTVDRPCTVIVKDSSGTVAQTNNSYDSKGNLVSSSRLVSGTTYLASSATYNSNGSMSSSTDVNQAVTHYNYNGAGGCNNLLVTSTILPVGSLTTSQTWDCNGGVATSVAGLNSGQTTTTNYVLGSTADPLYRPLSLVDPMGNASGLVYSPTAIESAMNFNGSISTSDTLATADGLGRPIFAQKRQGQGSSTFDSTQTIYGWGTATGSCTTQPPHTVGACTTQSVPYSGTAGQAAPSGTAVTTTQYDALGRPLAVTDGGGGMVKYTYVKNDTLQSVGPPPSGENWKSRQFEYDSLGRLTSVCEITSGPGGGTCGQSNPATGFLTKYTYVGNVLTVSQNAQPGAIGGAQTRTYQYDGLGRLIAETNPESGTITYSYDSDSSGTCPGAYKGDVVKRVDNAGNVSCYTYDGLHRQLSTTYSGPNATTNRYFIYDGATVNGQSMANAKGRMAEAYTAASSTGSKVTDEGFGYTARGEVSDFYESTPNSGGYYHIPMTYWANGLIETFGPFLTEAQVSTTPDGEGRLYSISNAGSNVPSITYNVAGQPTQIMTSCAGSTCYPINYQYDTSTQRMTQYGAALSKGTISGTLTWNPNGNLQKLVIADPLNSADAQTCTYSADDLSRIASVNCVSGTTNIWAQTFSYDAFGNISKSGSISWIPGYSSNTNHYALTGTSYDADGNVTNDTFNQYVWDAEGKPVSAGGNTFVYDAFGHRVEWLINGHYENSFVTLGRYKASAVGQTPFYSEFPFPGGSLASQGGGLTAVQLADWLGTTRAAYSYTGGNFIESMALAPFGETYVGGPQNFTGQWSDGNASNTTFYFPERQYRSSQGRWLSPDAAGLAAVDPSNPQSWNR